MASDDIMTAGAGGATATARADIKAAFFDIDGTLTSFVTHVIPQSSIDALHELQDRGVKVFICSGRAPSHMTVVLDMMPVHFDGIIALNGQYCFDDHGLLEKESLLPEDIVTITAGLTSTPTWWRTTARRITSTSTRSPTRCGPRGANSARPHRP